MKTILRQASSFIAPILFCIVFPGLLLISRLSSGRSITNPYLLPRILGGIVVLIGLAGFILTTRMLILIGNGTIMPWDPTHKLVTSSLYGYVRNPMIISVITIVLGEALLFALIWLVLLGVLFFAINQVYFIQSEEPGLEKRFGQEYVEYKQHVPRWIPRLKPWHPA